MVPDQPAKRALRHVELFTRLRQREVCRFRPSTLLRPFHQATSAAHPPGPPITFGCGPPDDRPAPAVTAAPPPSSPSGSVGLATSSNRNPSTARILSVTASDVGRPEKKRLAVLRLIPTTFARLSMLSSSPST